jgi:hypothetical protein
MKIWRLSCLAAGLIVGLATPLLLAEVYLRTYPPGDALLFLGDQSPLAGPYKPDPVLGADYVSYQAFQAPNAAELAALGPLDDARHPTWAFFGNSFIRGRGMLADTARAALPGHRIFFLREALPIYLYVAQLRLLLRQGLRAERVFLGFMIQDLTPDFENPLALSRIVINPRGAITYRPLPDYPAIAVAVAHSRLALVGWARTKRYRYWDAASFVSPQVDDDVSRIASALGAIQREFGVPVTLILIPNQPQIYGRAGFAIQDRMTALFHRHEMDVFDARLVFASEENKSALFLPDGHLSSRGNELLLTALLDHLRRIGMRVGGLARVIHG